MKMLKILESGTRLEKPDNAACAPEMYATIIIIIIVSHSKFNLRVLLLILDIPLW